MAKKEILHPYLPQDVILPVEYSENINTLAEVLGGFFVIVGVVLVLTFIYASTRSHLAFGTRLKVCWFVVCALIHIVLEGYFSLFWKRIVGDQSYLSQLWKEYSKGDSRYVSGDSFTVCMEMVTAFCDGPVALWAAWAFLGNRPCRYVAQLILSVCQLYGDVLYFMTAYKENFVHGPYGHPQYFWFYFVFMNIIWIIIPSILIVQSIKCLTVANASYDRHQAKKKNH